MIKKTRKEKIIWRDIIKPIPKDLEQLRKKFDIHPIIIDELEKPSIRPRVEFFKKYIYFAYLFPVYNPKDRVSHRGEVDFIVTKNEVTTIRYEKLEAFKEFEETMRDKENHKKIFRDPLHFIYSLLMTLSSFEERQLSRVQEKIESVASKLFLDKEKEILREISYLKRDIAECSVITKPMSYVLESLINNGSKLWGDRARIYLNDILGEHLKLVHRLENYENAVKDHEDTNSQLLGLKINEVAKNFSILAFLTFPLMLFAALFSMNTTYTPLVGQKYGFWIILGAMAVSMIIMFIYFKKKHWL